MGGKSSKKLKEPPKVEGPPPVKCTNCETGSFHCKECDGDGKFKGLGEVGLKNCKACNGVGRITCKVCQGTTYVMTDEVPKDPVVISTSTPTPPTNIDDQKVE